MTTNEMLAHLIDRSPWVDPARTVDTVKFGDGDKAVETVAVCWYPSLANLRQAVQLAFAQVPVMVSHRGHSSIPSPKPSPRSSGSNSPDSIWSSISSTSGLLSSPISLCILRMYRAIWRGSSMSSGMPAPEEKSRLSPHDRRKEKREMRRVIFPLPQCSQDGSAAREPTLLARTVDLRRHSSHRYS